MADFKLKPGAGTGNKLILESQDGTDVLTTSDSGVTLASATLTAPTIADLSNVTGTLPVGVTGGSGLTALGTVTSANFNTIFPFTSLTQNFGKMRIIVGSGTAAASSSYFAASGLYYNLFTVTYSGFSDTPKIFMTIGGGSHETGVGAYYQVSSTSTNIYLNSRVSSQVVSQAVYYMLIGTAS